MRFKKMVEQFGDMREFLRYVAENDLSDSYQVDVDKLKDTVLNRESEKRAYIKYIRVAQDIDGFLTLLLDDNHPLASGVERKREIVGGSKDIAIIQLRDRISHITVIQLTIPVVMP